MDAIIAGIGTVLADNPQLTVRPPGARTPTRIVLDSQGRIHDDSILVQTARTTPTLIAVTDRIPATKKAELLAHGCEVLIVPDAQGRVGIDALLEELGRRRFTNVLVEGGSEILGSFLDARAIDEVHVFIAPLLIGGSTGVGAMGGTGSLKIAQALKLAEWRHEVVDGDLYVHGWR